MVSLEMNESQNPDNLRRAIFIDRDGTLNEEVGYIRKLTDFRLFDFSAEAVKLINEAGWMAIVVTNQSGIARGLFGEDFLQQVHEQMSAELEQGGARIDAIYYCPHHPEIGEPAYRRNCDCRKPEPGLLRRAVEDFGVDLQASVIIGDRFRDVEMAQAVGARGVLVLTGYGREEFEKDSDKRVWQPDYVAENLLEAVKWAIKNDSTKF